MTTQNDTQIVDKAMQLAWSAFTEYKNSSLQKRAELLQGIAKEIEALGDTLISTAMAETNLSEARLHSERTRTLFQLTSYAAACQRGDWLEASIDTANAQRTPAKPDIRKMRIPLGPVAVFGASNFPFAYSTAGGDTASALAAGCPVIVKAHNAHIHTSGMVANAISMAVKKMGLPNAVFTHLESNDNALAKELVMHPHLKAVGFTGSFAGGKAIWEYANNRKEPIPVFAEMSSVNPVFLLPQKLTEDQSLADTLAASIILGSGQFCTNPGIIIVMEGNGLAQFKEKLTDEIQKAVPAAMLNSGIAENFRKTRSAVLQQKSVSVLSTSLGTAALTEDIPTVAQVLAKNFLEQPALQAEVFGSFSLLVICANASEMQRVAAGMEGQLTSSVMATEEDIINNTALISEIKNHCGRLILNGVPTGVEVVQSMHHGGPYPSSTDSRFTSVGADAIKRFARPLCFQNWPDVFLPDELKNSNPLNIWRTINNELTKAPVKDS
jgi:alpha-ketoglutaric semialdehyde dehydrogenase